MRILTFTTLFPNVAQPTHSVFVENRLRHVAATGEASFRVVAPVPWFPSTSPRFGSYAEFAAVPAAEDRNGIPVHHPRYPVIPKIGMTAAPMLMYLAVRPFIARLVRDGHDFDLIDSHYFYPDGVAAALLAREFGKPLTITARGTDLNLIPRYALPRRQIQWAARRADGLITVCQALKDVLVDLGIAADRVNVLRNGVDLDMFQPVDREAARRRVGVDGTVLLTVGHLIPRKGNHMVVGALPSLPDVTLLIAGDGPERGRLEAQAKALGVADRVRFLGRIPHGALNEIYGAADIMVLASDREGWANVLLEAMACGTPVVASDVWGTGEVVATPAAGALTKERSADGVAEAVKRLLAAMPDRAATRAYAEGFDWNDTTQGQLRLFRSILGHG